MSDYGKVYFYNLTDQTLYLELNDAPVLNSDGSDGIAALGKGPDYTMSRANVNRSANPNPYQSAEFGLDNTIKFWRADDKGSAVTFEIKIDPDQPGYQTDDDLLIFVYYKSLVLRVEGFATFYGEEGPSDA
jgi:hypothetical protein